MNLIKILVLLILFNISVFAQTIKIGVTPYTNAMKIIKVYNPISNFLSQELDTNVEIFTAKDYKEFYKEVEKGSFDLVITSPHFGALHIEHGFIPLYRYDISLQLLFLVLKDSNYHKISDLKNTVIATPNYLAALNVGSMGILKNYGLVQGVNFKLEDLGSHTSAIKSVLLKECDAAITTYTPLKQLSFDIKDKTRILKSDYKLPHLFTLANPNLGDKKIAAIKASLKKFESSQIGKNFFKNSGYKGYREITKEDIAELSPLKEITTKFLGN